LHLMGAAGYALDVELTLAPANECMEITNSYVGLTPNYSLTNVSFNLCLLEVSDAICAKFNEVACSDNESVIIPYTSFHNHTSTQNSQTATHFISEAATDLQSVYVAIMDNAQAFGANSSPLDFKGGAGCVAINERVERYNIKTGNNFVYNEDIISLGTDNNESLSHFKNSVYNNTHPMWVEKHDPNDNVTMLSRFESGKNFLISSTFTYSHDSKNASQGINTSGLPIQLSLKMRAAGAALTIQSFVKIGYNLVIGPRGACTYVEINDFSRTSY